MPLNERAHAKVNLTLAVLGRRADGYHLLDSLVAFADIADELSLEPGPGLSLEVSGPTASHAGECADNLVLKAARTLALLRPGLMLGHFHLVKHLPAQAGIGGGSSDAAAALRLLARANGLTLEDGAVVEAARRTGSDVPVCLEGASRWMRGAGEILSPPVVLPELALVLLNPGTAIPTADVFRALAYQAGEMGSAGESLAARLPARVTARALLDVLAESGNDLERPSIVLRPIIADALSSLAGQPDCRLARMSGSGATVYGLFDDAAAAAAAARAIGEAHPDWWLRETFLRSLHPSRQSGKGRSQGLLR